MWNDRINKYLPEGVKVSHKIGTFEGVCNDVGIIFADWESVWPIMQLFPQPMPGFPIKKVPHPEQ